MTFGILIQNIAANLLSGGLLTICLFLAFVDLLSALGRAIQAHVFTWALLPKWAEDKLLGQVFPIFIAYLVAAAIPDTKVLGIEQIADGAFFAAATAAATTFILAELASIGLHVTTPMTTNTAIADESGVAAQPRG